MVIEKTLVQDSRFMELANRFPAKPIHDDRSYHKAIQILDDLFAKGDQRSECELIYFRSLARFAARYEEATGMCV